MKNKKIYVIALIAIILGSCTNQETPVDKSKLLGYDYRLFQGSIAWGLAKATKDSDTDKIKSIASKNKQLVDFKEPRLGQTLLQMAVMTEKYNSVVALLECGANPNSLNTSNGRSPLMEAANVGDFNSPGDSRYLKILLKYGGNPNLESKNMVRGNYSIQTPLTTACSHGSLEYVKILVNAGANVNYRSEYGENALYSAIIANNPDIVLYLINKGADYKQPMFVNSMGKKEYIMDALRSWQFDLGSEEYKKKMKLVKFLKEKGMD